MRKMDEITDGGVLDQIANAKLIHTKGMVSHLASPALPGYVFEWHPETNRVYAIRKGSTPLVGELIVEKIADQTTFARVVEIWIKGYREGHTRLLGDSNG